MTRRDTRRTALDGTVSDNPRVSTMSSARPALALLAGVALAASSSIAAPAPSTVAVATPKSVTGNPNGDAFNMTAASTNVAENGGSITLTVLREGVGAGQASVDYATGDFTAITPQDYTAVSGTLTWADGDLNPQSVTIPIIDDTIHQGDLTFSFGLSNPQGAGLGVLPSEAVVIVDDETAPAAPAIAAPTLDAIGRTLLGGILVVGAVGAMRRRRAR